MSQKVPHPPSNGSTFRFQVPSWYKIGRPLGSERCDPDGRLTAAAGQSPALRVGFRLRAGSARLCLAPSVGASRLRIRPKAIPIAIASRAGILHYFQLSTRSTFRFQVPSWYKTGRPLGSERCDPDGRLTAAAGQSPALRVGLSLRTGSARLCLAPSVGASRLRIKTKAISSAIARRTGVLHYFQSSFQGRFAGSHGL